MQPAIVSDCVKRDEGPAKLRLFEQQLFDAQPVLCNTILRLFVLSNLKRVLANQIVQLLANIS